MESMDFHRVLGFSCVYLFGGLLTHLLSPYHLPELYPLVHRQRILGNVAGQKPLNETVFTKLGAREVFTNVV